MAAPRSAITGVSTSTGNGADVGAQHGQAVGQVAEDGVSDGMGEPATSGATARSRSNWAPRVRRWSVSGARQMRRLGGQRRPPGVGALAASVEVCV